VISMTRAGSKLTRLARALKPVAVLLELDSDGAPESSRELSDLCVLLFSRDAAPLHSGMSALASATDAALIQFVESRSS